MKDNAPTLLDRLDQTPVGPAPLAELLAAGRAAKRRRRRVATAGTTAAMALVLGGATLAASSITSDSDVTGLFADDTDLTVRITHRLPPQTDGGAGRRVLAIWDGDDKSLTYVTGMHYSGSCPPTGTATVTAQGSVSLEIQENTGPGVCTADAGRYTAVIEGLASAPTTLRVTEVGRTRNVPFVQVGPTLKEESSAAEGDTRLVGIGRAAVAVPTGWASNDASCNAPIHDTYFFPYPQDCVVPSRPAVSSVAITAGEFTETGTFLRNLHADGEIAGHQVRADEQRCQTIPNGPCRQTFGIPDLDAYFTVTIPEDGSGSATAEIAAIRASLRVLPGDQIAVPYLPEANEGDIATSLHEAGLAVTVEHTTCPAAADCVVGVVGTSPAEGSVVPVGSPVTVRVMD
jgi:hypothetical protein